MTVHVFRTVETSCFIPFSEFLPTSAEKKNIDGTDDKNLYPSIFQPPERSFTAINANSGSTLDACDCSVDIAVVRFFFLFLWHLLYPRQDEVFDRLRRCDWVIINFLTSLRLGRGTVFLSSATEGRGDRSFSSDFFSRILGIGPTATMMEAQSPEVLWILILGFIVGFFLAFGVGANDVANSFGTSVGSKALSLRQACILATIFEIMGSVLMGYKVSDTVRKGIFDVETFSEFEKELMLGFLASLIGSAIWNIVATFFRWPISGTHSIIGAVVGFVFVARGFMGIKWKMLGKIVSSWFLSPVLSGLISSALFLIVKKFILTKDNAIERAYLSLPFFWGFTIFVNLFSVVHNGPRYLGFDLIPWWGVFILAGGVGLIFGLCVFYILVPYLQSSSLKMGDSENSENQIAGDELPSKISYPEAENLGFEENGKIGHEIPLGKVSSSYSLDLSSSNNTSVSTIGEDLTKNIHKDKLPSGAISDTDTPEAARVFSSLQILTAIFASFAHGANDVSNAIGPVIAIYLIYQDGNVLQEEESPFWIMLFGGFGISVGLWVWGQKVIKTIGEDLTTITPSSGFCIEIGAAATVLLASKIGLPISTTHCKVGSIVFVGWARSRTAVDWKLFRSIVLAWVLTLPISAALSAAAMAILTAVTS